MARVDYGAHQDAYLLRKQKEPLLTVAQYCEDTGLNYNSARRYIKHEKSSTSKPSKTKAKIVTSKWPGLFEKYLKIAIKAPMYSQNQFAQDNKLNANTMRGQFAKLRREGICADLDEEYAKACEKLHQERLAENSNELNIEKSKAYYESGEQIQTRTQQMVEVLGGGNDPANDHCADHSELRSTFDRRKLIRLFMPGNVAGYKHGGFSNIFRASDKAKEIVNELCARDISSELYAARVQYYSMLSHQQDLLFELEQKNENGDLITNTNNEPSTYLAEKSKLIAAYADRMRVLEGSIANMVGLINANEVNQAKIILAAAKLPMVDSQRELEILNQALQLRADNDWDAMTTAKYLEGNGAKVPAYLLTEARRELDLIEPEIDDNGISDSEAEELSRNYMEGRKSLAAQITEKRNMVLDAFEEAELADSVSNLNGEDDNDSEYDDLDAQPSGKSLFDDIELDDLTTLS